MRLSTVLASTGLISLANATPVAPASPRPLPQVHPVRARQNNGTNLPPCAQVSQVIYSVSPRPIATYIPAQLAFDCINSIPLNVSSAKNLLAELPAYIRWQSTLETLKNPPAEYAEKVQPPVDILGGLQQISADIDAGKFSSEYDFGWTLYTLIQSAHDGHFTYVPDSVNNIFNWGRPIPLVSVSSDGTQLPSIFAFEDVLGLQFKNISYVPSPVVQIDGIDATEFLEDLSQYGSLQDRDALYNNVFYELAQVSLGTNGGGTGMFSGGGRGRWVYPGANTTLIFANGTQHTMENYARVLTTFRGIQTAQDLADFIFTYGNAGSVESQTISEEPVKVAEAPEASAAAPGYPVPKVAGPSGLINGFYVDGPGNEDVAVLQIPNFVGSGGAFIGQSFQKTSQTFIPQALADGKTKLIIDLQANGGGTILQGYDLYKQLFPSSDPYGANRFRYTEAADLVGQSFSAFGSRFPRDNSANATVRNYQASYFDFHQDMTVDGKPFESWQQKVGPVEANGDKYTSLSRWNLSDIYTLYNGGINITGYGPLANVTGSPRFKPENIVLLTDGYCASTCTIFSEFLRKQEGVKTIALGGRSNRNQIQAIGGVKGVNNFQWPYIQSLTRGAILIGPPELKLNSSVLAREYSSSLPFARSYSTGVNVRDGLALNDTSGIALQFIYEEADCRLYYTPAMTVDATAVWKAAAAAQWGNSGKCVKDGGYGQKRATHDVTTKLNIERIKVSSAAALQAFEAFEQSLGLETECKMEADGFMHP